MFIHFGILTYTGSWSQANLPISMFNPVNLNPGQWADAAVAAKMKYAVLTTRHHDGFALWPSAVGNFSVRNISWRNGQGDVVREFVDAFRARSLRAVSTTPSGTTRRGPATAPPSRARRSTT